MVARLAVVIRKNLIEILKGDRNEIRRYSAVLIIKELAVNTPNLVYSYMHQVLDCIWTGLRDSKLQIRETAAETLGSCLKVMVQRDAHQYKEWYLRVYSEASKGILSSKSPSTEFLHGSLLALKEMFRCTPKVEEIAVNRGFVTFGELAVLVGYEIAPYLESFMKTVKETLAKSKSRTNDSVVFQSVGNVAKAVGPVLTRFVHDVLDVLFALGLTESLCRLLSDLCLFVPPLKAVLQDRLLDLLSLVLCGEKYEHLALVKKLPRDFFIVESRDSELIILALNALGSFEFAEHSLLELVRECAALYLYDESSAIRKAAALTCCKLIVRDPINYTNKPYASKIVNSVFEKLLVVGITDLGENAAGSQYLKLDHRFSQPHNIKSIFAALNDEDFVIRELAIVVIGRLSLRYPTGVIPLLRQALIQFLTEIQYSGVSSQTEESAKLLAGLIASSHHLVKPYVSPILKILLPKTKDSNPNISAKIITAVCELSRFGNEDFLPVLNELLDILVEAIRDPTSAVRREAALKTLGQLSTNVGIAVTPYQKYPELLGQLIEKFKTEQNATLRRETVTVVGLLGALDPFRLVNLKLEAEIGASSSQAQEVPFQSIPTGPSSEEYCPMVAIESLMRIIQDVSAGAFQSAAVTAIIQVFEKSGSKVTLPLLPKVLPRLLKTMRSCAVVALEFYTLKLVELTGIVKRNIRPYLNEMFGIIKEKWHASANFQVYALNLIDAVAIAVQSDLKVFIPSVLPQILQVFELDAAGTKPTTQRVLESLLSLNSGIDEHMHLVVPIIVKLFENTSAPIGVRKLAIQVVGQMSRSIKFNQSSRVIHPLIRIINGPVIELKIASMDALSTLATKLGTDFSVFIPMINKIIARNNVRHARYDMIVSKILKNEKLPMLPELGKESSQELARQDEPIPAKKFEVDMPRLKRSWDTANKATKADWMDWMRRLGIDLLRESPQPALRACSSLAANYPVLARELFNVGFVSCWWELYDQFQDDLVNAITTAMNSPTFPAELTQTILNLAEFMERDESKEPLPISRKILGQYATKCHAWAKALYYKEIEFMTEPTPATVETLIGIYNQLQQPDSAVGILRRAHLNHNVELVSTWYEKLNRWEDALISHEQKSAEDPSSFEALHGRMRCLSKLGEWEALSKLAKESWKNASDEAKKEIAPFAAAGAWGVAEWEDMEQYVKMIKSDSKEGAHYRAVLSLHRNLFPQASYYIEKSREMLDSELIAISGESYSRSYKSIVRCQTLVEMEEIIKYKQLYEFPDRQAIIRTAWMRRYDSTVDLELTKYRLKGCQRDVDIWLPIMRLRELVLTPELEPKMWIKFAKICRNAKRANLSFRALSAVINSESRDFGIIDLEKNSPEIIFACLQHVYDTNTGAGEVHAFEQLRKFTKKLAAKLGIPSEFEEEEDAAKAKLVKLLSKCYLKLGQWQLYLRQYDLDRQVIAEMTDSFQSAVQLNKSWYTAWNEWCIAYTYIIKFYEKSNSSVDALASFVVLASKSFFQSIALSKTNSLQDTLRLLTIWFKYGHIPEVNTAISEGCGSVSVDTWLQVIPQLIARIHSHSPDIQKLVQKLLTDVGKDHPQALVYALTIASKSQNDGRRNAAVGIMNRMRVHSSNLIEQVLLVSEELIRVAILWVEMWHEGLEEASRYYFSDDDVDGMLAVLEPLHKILEKGPETLREVSFYQAYGRDLAEAYDWCRSYKTTGNVNDMNQGWDLYYKVMVFRKILAQLPQLTTLDLHYVSPKLLAATDLELAVPGTYKSGDSIVKIASFEPMLKVMTSKARPRRLTIKGADGVDYQYLLKGHDDLRQDERVMQLFGLVNTLLNNDQDTFQRQLSIRRYSVTPLSEITGLIGFVPNCDTLNQIIKDFRENRKIVLHIEQKLMSEMNPNYDMLPLIHKVEIFEHALNKTDGMDFCKMLWWRSKNAEVWLDRRTNYTRSLALMSMVGYVLGLGDRHPSNLMIDRFTGKVVHIDFGDCFEVAMDREKFPEKVPFRLTRMLINAMEVSGIEGNFRITCEHVMRVLRNNKGSVMAVLEAFVHDPLINWRLMGNASPKVEPRKNAAFDENDILENEQIDGIQSTRRRGSKMFKSAKSHGNNLLVQNQEQAFQPEAINTRAVSIVNRVESKLNGTDFKNPFPLAVDAQVDKLILQATSTENLCQNYVGWCAYW
ncbi:phosphatidylinositol kinase- protein kinase tor1 [Entophlyctis luteolus]|nr:phosphatidylinositol kinase- protein kinase tor1 [Entophlyctis luteolus]